jgi:hypothetical protein
MARYLYYSGQHELLALLRGGPVLLSELAHMHQAADRVACLKKVMRGTGLTISSERVTKVSKFGAFKDRRYRLVRE